MYEIKKNTNVIKVCIDNWVNENNIYQLRQKTPLNFTC